MPSLVNLGAGNTTERLDDYLEYINSKIGAKPLRGGVIVDLKNSIALLKPVLKKSRNFFKKSPVSLASAPTDTSEHERDLLRQALVHAGASHVSIIPEVWAAAVGADIDLSRPRAQLLIDIGDGVTDMAVIRVGQPKESRPSMSTERPLIWPALAPPPEYG
jgi:rod shape-determining protein MreB